MKKSIRRITSMLLALVMAICFSFSAMANEYNSSTRTAKVYNINYSYWSSINSSNGKWVLFSTYGKVHDSCPAGYMGLQPRLFAENGTLVKAYDWHYNASDYAAGTRLRVPYNYDGVVKGKYYYSCGQVKFYNGDGYTTYVCAASPNTQVPVSTSSVKRNIHGELYGIDGDHSQNGMEVDLIQAIGNNGRIGYVKRSDLDGNDVSNPSEVFSYVDKCLDCPGRIIPIYESDGVTVIDSFTVLAGGTLEEVVID